MKVICFDLDDTLYKEIDYIHSAYRDIACGMWVDDWEKWYMYMVQWYETGENVFEKIRSFRSDVEVGTLINMYRFGMHSLRLSDEVRNCLESLQLGGVKLGLITDGRSLTQRNKIKALGLNEFFDEENIIISEEFGSEKPSVTNFKYFMKKFPGSMYTYVADNPKKDFIGPNILGWDTVCLMDDGRNVHKQEFESVGVAYLPKKRISVYSELLDMAIE